MNYEDIAAALCDGAVEVSHYLPQEKERRRYALLQAAATVYDVGGAGVVDSVQIATALLAEIESREVEGE